MARSRRILLLGDSYAAGRLPHGAAEGALAAQLRKLGFDVCGNGLSGSTAATWCHCFLRVPNFPNPDDVFLSIGGNDLFRIAADGVINPDELHTFFADVTRLFKLVSSSYPATVVHVFLYPNPYKGFCSNCAVNDLAVNLLDESLAALANACGEKLWPFDLRPVLTPECFDGLDVHPTMVGYERLAGAIEKLIGGSKCES